MKTFASDAKPLARPRRLSVLTVLAGLLLVPGAGAQDAASQRATGSEGSQNGPNAELPWQARGKFDPVLFMNPFSSHYIVHRNPQDGRTIVFFPPVPPPLESEIPILAPFEAGPSAPGELEAFVTDIFYPLLGERLVTGDLPTAVRAKIVAYRNAKVSLQDELRSRVLSLKDADPESRARQLASLAALQAPRISELEAMAEKLRADLRPSRVFGISAGSSDLTESLALRVRAVRETPTDPAELRRESLAIRGAAFYQEGLSLGQRSLLLEAAIELEANAGPESGASKTAPVSRLLLFSPETARIRIPKNLEPPLEAKIGEYVSAKNALKAELRDALRSTEETGADARREALSKLASLHAPRIAHIEALAEEVRRGLASLPNPPGAPASPSLPPELTTRISIYRRHKVELLKTLRAMLDTPTPTADLNNTASTVAPGNAAAGTLAWMHDSATSTEIQPSALRVSVAEFDHRQSELVTALNAEEAGIRVSLAAYVRATTGTADRKSVNDLLRDFENARQDQEIRDRYRDYQTAVLLPGLSPGQRRVIFDAGVEQLALPLPTGEKLGRQP
jgi:hypothetical protein